MSLLFVGDIASPDQDCSLSLAESLQNASSVFTGKTMIANLEGLVATNMCSTRTPVLYNDKSVLSVLKNYGCSAVSLANNHTLDLPANLLPTKKHLDEMSIASFGAGISTKAAAEPALIKTNGHNVRIFGYCWDILMQHQKPGNGCHVNPLCWQQMLRDVETSRCQFPDDIIVLSVHWNFDLETAPFPLHRELSKELIDAGANAVIGSHSHCVQGGERYKNGLIVYGLGNFFIPWNTFINGTIHFPDFARNEMVIDWDPVTGKASCHWFRYENDCGKHTLRYDGTENFDSGQRIKGYSPYRGMTTKNFSEWFSSHRRKRKLLPIYYHHRQRFRNQAIDTYLRNRIRFARFLAKRGLHQWNR